MSVSPVASPRLPPAPLVLGALVVMLVALLEIAVRTNAVSPLVVVAPSTMVAKVADLASSGELWPPLRQTFGIVVQAITLSVVVGMSLGTLLHRVPRLRQAVDPILASYYAVPIFIFYPLLIVLFGLGDLPLLLIGAAFSLVAMVVATLNALDRIPLVYLASARVMRLGPVATFFRVRLPAMTPDLMVGLKVAVAYAVIGVIGSEFILAPEGVGFRIAYAYNNFDNAGMYAFMLVVIVVVTAVNMTLHAWERRIRRRMGR